MAGAFDIPELTADLVLLNIRRLGFVGTAVVLK
jgi:hypothetical protein